MMTERKRRFIEAYSRLANATKAAIEAGYSTRSAHVIGPRMVYDKDVMQGLEAKRVKRDVHADITYSNLIALAQIALEEVSAARKAVQSNVPNSDGRLSRAVENARRCLETVGRAESLFIQRIEHTGANGAPIQHEHVNMSVELRKVLVELPTEALSGYEQVLAALAKRIGSAAAGGASGTASA